MLISMLLCIVSSTWAAPDTFPLTGKIVLPGTTSVGTSAPMLLPSSPDGAPAAEFGSLQMWVHLNGGRQLTTFVKRDGSFVLHGVPAGTHLLSIDSPTFMFPQLRVDIGPQRNGIPTVTLADDDAIKLQEPLVIRPAALASYFEERKAFNVVGFLKSPMGIISGAHLVG